MANMLLKPCPFCGGMAYLYGEEIRDYVNGSWAEKSRKEYWVSPNCWPSCDLGNTHARAFGVFDGIRYTSPKAAAEAWNKRAETEKLEQRARRWELEAAALKTQLDEFGRQNAELITAWQNALKMRNFAYSRLCDWCGICPADRRNIEECEIARLGEELVKPESSDRPDRTESGQLIYSPSEEKTP